MIEKIDIKKIFPNPVNPRIIKDFKFKKLVKSIKDFPEMLELRPIIVNKEGGIIGGNMRYRACKELGLKEVFIIRAENLNDKQIEQFIIKDNLNFGEWDWDNLANQWDMEKLEDWGMDTPTNWGLEDVIMDKNEIKQDNYMAVVVVAYNDINDLDKITSLYELNSVDINDDIRKQISGQRKAYVFKK